MADPWYHAHLLLSTGDSKSCLLSYYRQSTKKMNMDGDEQPLVDEDV